MVKFIWLIGVLLLNFIRFVFLKNKFCCYVIKNVKLVVNNLWEYVFVMECILYKCIRLYNLKVFEKWYIICIYCLIFYV